MPARWPARVSASLALAGVGAAVTNAIYNACGARVRDYPMTLDKVLAGMSPEIATRPEPSVKSSLRTGPVRIIARPRCICSRLAKPVVLWRWGKGAPTGDER